MISTTGSASPSTTPAVISRPAMKRSTSTSGSHWRASASAGAQSAGDITREMPTLEPSRGGLTTTGSGRRVVVAPGASTSYSAVGTPCAARRRLVAILSMASRLAAAPAPV